MKWIKIVTDIFDDDKILLIESMPEADAIIVIWFKLLCLAGKQNNSGVFLLNGRIAYTDEMFATIFRRPLSTVRLALKTFEQFGMIEIINDTVTIPNWEKHQKLDALEASREATRNRVARHREKQKLLVDSGNVTGNVTVTDGNADRIDKNREDKNREDKNNSNARAREENPFGDGGGEERPDFNTVEAYVANNIPGMNYANMQEMESFKDDLPEDVIRYAVDRACERNIRNWGYVKGILNKIIAAGLHTLAEVKEHDAKFAGSGKATKANPALDYEQRDYKPEDDSGLFINLEEYVKGL